MTRPDPKLYSDTDLLEEVVQVYLPAVVDSEKDTSVLVELMRRFKVLTLPKPKVAADGSRWDAEDKELIRSYERLTGKRVDVDLRLVWQVKLGTGPLAPLAQSDKSPSDALVKVIKKELAGGDR